MDRITEEIILVPGMTHNQDDEVLTKRKLRCKSRDIQDQRRKRDVFINLFNHLNKFLLWIILLICLILIAGPLALHVSYRLPAMKTRNTAVEIFSEERARDYLSNLTVYGSRVSNTRGDFSARHFLISQLKRICSINKRQLRYEIERQNFTDRQGNQLQNIIARLSNPVRKSKNVTSLLLTAHYDTVEFSVGASDDGSGIVILLELLSNLINDLTLTSSDVDIIVLFTGAEEINSQGATEFISNHAWYSDIRYFINIDASNCNEKATLNRLMPSELAVDYSRVPRPRANVIIEYFHIWFRLMSDYDSFIPNYSLLGYEFGFLLDSYTYHTILDYPSTIKQGVIQDIGENLGVLIRNILLGNVNLKERENMIDDDPFIYFDILGQYLIVYKLSTSIILQRILILLVLFIGIILISFDDIWHRKRNLSCNNCRCIYFQFKYPLIIRISLIFIYFICNILSVFVGILLSLIVALIVAMLKPLAWYGNATLAICLFSLPCLIGIILVGYFWNSFHRFIRRKWPKNSLRLVSVIEDKHFNEVNLDFEQNFSVVFVYSLLMIVSICFGERLSYLILVWSIFICPMYLLLMIVEFILHWKELHWTVFEQGYHWLFLPLIISLVPLTHTIELVHRLVRIFIPFMARTFSFGLSRNGNLMICGAIAIPTMIFLLIFLPILQRTKYFGRILIALFIPFLIIFIIAYNRQPFTNTHPHSFYALHTSNSIYYVETLSNHSFIVPLTLQSSSITITTYDGLGVLSVLDDFSVKSGHTLHNQQCVRMTRCTFDDAFNRTMAVQKIEIKPMHNFNNYLIIIQHALSYSIKVSSLSLVQFIVVKQSNIPRRETIINVTLDSSLSSFTIDIRIRRCDLNDSPFLVLFTRIMSNMILMGMGQCQSIDDDTTIMFNNKSSNG